MLIHLLLYWVCRAHVHFHLLLYCECRAHVLIHLLLYCECRAHLHIQLLLYWECHTHMHIHLLCYWECCAHLHFQLLLCWESLIFPSICFLPVVYVFSHARGEWQEGGGCVTTALRRAFGCQHGWRRRLPIGRLRRPASTYRRAAGTSLGWIRHVRECIR